MLCADGPNLHFMHNMYIQNVHVGVHNVVHVRIGATYCITRYGSTLYMGIAMVVPILQYIRKCQFLLSVSSEFDF